MNYSTYSSASSNHDEANTPGGLQFVATHTEQVEWVGGLSRPGATKDRYIETNLKTQTTVTATTTSLPSLTNNDIVKPLHERLAEARAKAEEEFDDGTGHKGKTNYSLPRGLDEEEIAYLDEQRSIQERSILSAYDQEQQDKLEFLQQQERLQKEQERLEQERLQKIIGISGKLTSTASVLSSANGTKFASSSSTVVPPLAAKIIVKGNPVQISSSLPSSSSSTISPSINSPSPSLSSTVAGKRARSSNDNSDEGDSNRSSDHSSLSTNDTHTSTVHQDKRSHTINGTSSGSSSISSLPPPVFAKKVTTHTLLPAPSGTDKKSLPIHTTVMTGTGGGLVDYDTSSSDED